MSAKIIDFEQVRSQRGEPVESPASAAERLQECREKLQGSLDEFRDSMAAFHENQRELDAAMKTVGHQFRRLDSAYDGIREDIRDGQARFDDISRAIREVEEGTRDLPAEEGLDSHRLEAWLKR